MLDGKPGWELKQKTVPADGSVVRSGQLIEVSMTWDDKDFADAPLYHALTCVTVDGRLETALSLVEPDAPNDGDFIHRFAVPDGLPTGTAICSRGAIAGDGNGYFELNPSNDVCFTVAEDRTPPTPQPPPQTIVQPPPPVVPPRPVVTPPTPPPPAVVFPSTPPSPTVVPPPQTEVAPRVQGVTEERPPPAEQINAPVVRQAEQLPRTGHPGRPLILSAGLLLALGGAALIGAVKRR
ncbi:MAG: hypothetical protein M3357_17255 [Actinomycetota bacterium]|nr:hypothetical protein [Actinomycetota bacterium]